MPKRVTSTEGSCIYLLTIPIFTLGSRYSHFLNSSLLITCHDLEDPLKSIRYWGSTVLNLDAGGVFAVFF